MLSCCTWAPTSAPFAAQTPCIEEGNQFEKLESLKREDWSFVPMTHQVAENLYTCSMKELAVGSFIHSLIFRSLGQPFLDLCVLTQLLLLLLHVISCLLAEPVGSSGVAQGKCVTNAPAGMEVEDAAVSLKGAGRHGVTDSSLASTSTSLSGSPYDSVLLALLEGLRCLPLPLALCP